MAKKTVRILRQLPVDGVIYRPDNLVTFEKEAAEQYIEAGAADDKKAGIDHCKSIGAEVINHVTPEPEAVEDNGDGEGDDGGEIVE